MFKIYNVYILEKHSEVYKKLYMSLTVSVKRPPAGHSEPPVQKSMAINPQLKLDMHSEMQLLGDQLLCGLCPIVLCTKYKYLSYLTKC